MSYIKPPDKPPMQPFPPKEIDAFNIWDCIIILIILILFGGTALLGGLYSGNILIP